MKYIKRFESFSINEQLENVGMITKVFAKAITDPFSISILPDILKMTKGEFDKPETWMEPYKNIFRKACKKFGGAKKPDVNGTCNKDLTIKSLYEHMLGKNGIMDEASIDKYFTNLLKGIGPNQVPVMSISIEEIDKVTMMMIDTLSKTGVSDAAIKEVGGKVMAMAIPYMKRCYPKTNLDALEMISSGKLMNPADLAKIASGKDASGKISI